MNRFARACAAAAILLGVMVTPPTLARADGDANDGATLTVTVTDGSTPTPRPTSSASPTPLTPGGGSSAGGGAAGSGGEPAGGGGGSGADTPPGGVSIAGMLYLSGVNSSVGLSPDPSGGDVTVWLSVRNASTGVVDLTADFWMESVLFAVPLDEARGVPVTGLQPGETRLVSMRLRGAGQWGLVNTHVRITPPAVLDGTTLSPVIRDAVVVVFPWLTTLIGALVVIGLLTWRAIVIAVAAARPAEVAA